MASLCLLYKANPWTVVKYGLKWGDRQDFVSEGVTWPYGEIRGGTTPVRVGDLYFTFHHSSLPWRGRYRRYYAGCIAFDAKPPFTPRMITSEPLLHGSQNDRWAQKKPLVIFPCGSFYKDGKWLVTCGVNDLKSAWVELSHESLLSKMRPIGDVSDTIFGSNGLSEGERNLSGDSSKDLGARAATTEKSAIESHSTESPSQTTLEKRRAALVKARAAMAAKRADAIANPITLDETVASIKPKKRRRKKYRRITSEARMKALKEYEAKKNVAPQ